MAEQALEAGVKSAKTGENVSVDFATISKEIILHVAGKRVKVKAITVEVE
jgi:hypothetical protein